MSFKNPTTYVHACPIFRYAEILLNAAEAINESEDRPCISICQSGSWTRGMPAYSGMTKEQLRERIFVTNVALNFVSKIIASLMNVAGNCLKGKLLPVRNLTSLSAGLQHL
ncbi:MAG: RagB/SusD family nutrient uptake outer membrane protein [Bacteroides graminisolvens]